MQPLSQVWNGFSDRRGLQIHAPHPSASVVPTWRPPWNVGSQTAAAGFHKAYSCPHCGNVYADDSLFCRKCGKPRAQVPNEVPPVPSVPMQVSKSTGRLGVSQTVQGQIGPQEHVTQMTSNVSNVSRQYSAPQEAYAMRPAAMPQVREVVEVTQLATAAALEDSIKQCQVVIREKPEVREREKVVEVPTISLSENMVEVPVSLVHEKVVEVPQVQVVEIMKQLPKVEYQERVVQ
ncbi:unnamed protein product, partial [Cladocopium goreaui]